MQSYHAIACKTDLKKMVAAELRKKKGGRAGPHVNDNKLEASFTKMSLNNARTSRTCFIVLPQTK